MSGFDPWAAYHRFLSAGLWSRQLTTMGTHRHAIVDLSVRLAKPSSPQRETRCFLIGRYCDCELQMGQV